MPVSVSLEVVSFGAAAVPAAIAAKATFADAIEAPVTVKPEITAVPILADAADALVTVRFVAVAVVNNPTAIFAEATEALVAVKLVVVAVVSNATALLIDATEAFVAVSVENTPVLGVDDPTAVPSIDPPVMATLLAFCVDIVPRPVMSELGICATAVNADVPDAFTYPVSVVAPVPPLETGKVPVTPVDKGKPEQLLSVPDEGVPSAPPLTTNAPADPTLVPSAVTTPVPVVVVLGATPAPPPMTSAFAASAAEDAIVVLLEKYGIPPEVPVVKPVPPLPTGSVPVT